MKILLRLLLLLPAMAYADPPGPLHFDSGMLDIRKQDMPVLQAHCQYAAEHPEQHLMIQGHTDMRGSQEYSLAVGQARGERVRALMVKCGVAEQRIDVLTFGKERPLVAETSAAAGRANRRVEISYLP